MAKFVYTFVIHLSPEHKYNKNVRQLLQLILNVRTELIATTQEFSDIREEAFKDGFEFMEIEKVLYLEPEKVR